MQIFNYYSVMWKKPVDVASYITSIDSSTTGYLTDLSRINRISNCVLRCYFHQNLGRYFIKTFFFFFFPFHLLYIAWYFYTHTHINTKKKKKKKWGKKNGFLSIRILSPLTIVKPQKWSSCTLGKIYKRTLVAFHDWKSKSIIVLFIDEDWAEVSSYGSEH